MLALSSHACELKKDGHECRGQWSELILPPSPKPKARYGFSLARIDQRVLLFGGETATGSQESPFPIPVCRLPGLLYNCTFARLLQSVGFKEFQGLLLSWSRAVQACLMMYGY